MPDEDQNWFDPVFVVQGRVHEGLEFSAPDVRGLFIRMKKWQQQQWLETNPRYWRRVEDVQKKAASQQNRLETPAETIAARPSSPISSDIRKDDKDTRQGPTAADVVHLLQTAFPKTWERYLRNHLGVTDPADLTPAELARFTDHVVWLVKQTGIRDPAAWLAYRAQLDATMSPVERGSPVEISDRPAQRASAEREPVTLKNSPATTSAASPPQPVARTVAMGTTKAEVLSRAKAAIEAGESLRNAAEWLASAQEDFHASQREIGRAVGRSASWVNRLLKWRRSGYKQSSPFGPTTRAGRAPTGLNWETSSPDIRKDGDDDGNVNLAGRCSPPYQPASLPAPVIRAGRHKLSCCRAPRQPREKPRNLKHRLLHSGTRVANEVGAAVPNSRSKSCQQETRRSVESFHLSACEVSSRPSRNVPSSPAQPPKQAFTAKHLRIG